MASSVMDTSHKGIKHGVPARNEARLLVRVGVIPQNGCDIGEQHVKSGTHDVLIYVSQLAGVQALVRTDKAKADFARAQEVFANQVATLCRGIPSGAEGDAIRARKIAEFGGSPYEVMAQDPGYTGGFGKLLSCEVLEDVAAPPTVENLQATQFGKLGDVIAQAVAAGHAGSVVPTPEQIDARVAAEVERRMADLERKFEARFRAK